MNPGAEHPSYGPVPIKAAPTAADEFNTLGERLLPKGCFRMEDVRFEFDSSFIKPDTAEDMPHLADLIDKHTLKQVGSPPKDIPPPLSIFGHADPVGKEDYNKQLSGRRATAVYAMLVRDVELWEELYSKPLGRDDWGNQSIQTMLAAVGHPPGEDGKAAIKSFQGEKGLKQDGVAGPKTRKELYRAYMDFLCGPRLELDKKKNFLAQNQDAGGKGDYQGCSEFNPVLVFSKEEDQRFQKEKDKAERDFENAPNRRVMILLFAPGRRVNPKIWPCPRVKEGTAECKTRFFPDANERRSPQENRRKFEETKNTFACRFYQIITDDSPCEGVAAPGGFYYGLHMGPAMPWSEAATVRFISEEGAQKWEVPVSTAAVNGIYRIIEFPHGRPSVRYKGEVQEGKRITQLFGPSDLNKPLASPAEKGGEAPAEEADSNGEAGVSNPGVVMDPTLSPEERKAVAHAAESRKQSSPPSY